MATPNSWTMQYGPLTRQLASQGRGGDTMLAHMTPGDQVVPRQVQTPAVMTALNRAFANAGASPSEFRAGPSSGINPNTGLAEFQMQDDPNAAPPDAALGATYPSGGTPGVGYADYTQPGYAAPTPGYMPTGAGMSTQDLRNYHIPTLNWQAVQEARNPTPPPYDPNTWRTIEPAPTGVTPQAQQPQSAGIMGIVGRGIMRSVEEAQQTTQTLSGGTPTQSNIPPADFEQPVSLSDLTSPGTLVDKFLYQTAKSFPTIAGTVLGGGAGAVVGSAVGPEGTAAGTAIGGVIGAGLTSTFQALGPAYAQQLAKNPNNPDMAFDEAWKQAGIEGAGGALSQALFGLPIGKSFIKHIFMQAALVQPAAAAATTTASDIEQGKTASEIGQDVTSAALNAVVGTAGGETAYRGGRWLAGKWVPDANTSDSSKSMGDDQTAALTLALPPPSAQNAPRLPAPPIYAGAPPGPQRPGPLGPAAPDVVNAGAPAAQPQLPPPPIYAGAPGTGGSMGEPPATPPPGPPGLPPPGPANRPPPAPGAGNIAPPVQEGQVTPLLAAPARPTISEVPGAQPPGDLSQPPGGGYPGGEPPPPPAPPAPPPPESGGGPPPPAPGGGGEAPPPPDVTPGGGGTLMQLASSPSPLPPRGTTAEGLTWEPDDTGTTPGATVVKTATDGNVIAVGDNPQQALQFASMRSPAAQVAPEAAPEVVPEAPPGRGEVQPAATVEAPKPAGQPPAPTLSSQALGAPEGVKVSDLSRANVPSGEASVGQRSLAGEAEEAPAEQPLQRIPGQPNGLYRVRQEDNGEVHADIIDNRTGRKQSFFVADDGSIAKEGSDATPWKAPNDPAQQRAAELLEQGVRRSTGVRTVEPQFPAKVASALQKHVANFDQAPGEMLATAKAGGPSVGEQLKARRAKQAQPAPKRGNVFVAEPTSEEESATAMPRMSQMAEEAREEAEELTKGARVEPGTIPTAREAAGEAAPQTIAEVAGTEGVGERSPQTTNKEDFARDYLGAILRGEMTPEEAHEQYGTQGVKGRPRKFPTFRDYVESIRQAIAQPGALADRIKAVQQAYEGGQITRAQRAAQERSISASDLVNKHPADLQRIVDALDPERMLAHSEARMRASMAAFRGEPLESAIEPTDPTERTYHPEANRPIHDILDRLDDGDTSITSHDLLDAITNDSGPRVLTPHLAALARVLRRFLPEIPVAKDSPEMARRTAGRYDQRGDTILLNTSDYARNHPNVSMLETAVHESLHAATAHYVARLSRLAADGRLEGEGLRHMQALDAIQSELQRIRDNPNRPLTGYETNKLNRAIADKNEAITYLMTDARVQQLLREHTPSAALRSQLRRLGFSPDRNSSSVWQEFKNFIGHIFGLRGNTSVLDRVMDPLTSIVGQGLRTRTDAFGLDRFGRAGAEEKLHSDIEDATLNNPLRSPKDALSAGQTMLKDAVRSRGLMKAVLSVANLDAIHTFGRRLFESRDPEAPGNSLTDFRKSLEDRAAVTKAERDTYGNFVQRMYARLANGADGAKISQLMNDATLAEARLGDRDPRANAHLVTPEQQTRLKQLQDRYEALSQTAQQTYREMRDYYRETYNKERAAEFDHALHMFMPDSTPAERAALRSQVQTRAGIDRLLDGKTADDTPVAQAFGERWQNRRAVVQELGRLQRAGFVRGDYFPLRRYGDYVVRYGERGGPRYGAEFFERESQAQARREELLKPASQGGEGYSEEEVSPVFLKQQNDRARAAVGPSLDSLSAALDKAGMTGAAKENALNAYAEIQLRQGTRSQSAMMRARREGVLGASTDQARNLANDFLAYSARMGWLKHGPDQIDALDRMNRHIDTMRASGLSGYTSDQVQRAGMIRDAMNERLRPGDNSSGILGRTPQALSTFSFIKNLMRPAHMVVQLADAHSNAESLLGARHGFGAAGVALGKAVRDLGGTALTYGGRNAMKAVKQELQNSDWNISQLYRDRLAKVMNPDHATGLINALNAAGLIDHTMVREIQRMAQDGSSFDFAGKFGSSRVAGIGTGVMNMFGALEHAVDSMNRTAIAKAAFDLEMRRSNGDVQHSLDYAVQQARDAMPNYNLHNRPSLVGKLGALSPILQYKLYGMHMYSLMGNLAHDIYTGEGRGRSEAVKALSAILGSHALLAGVTASVFGSLPMAVGLGLYDLFRGDQKPHTAEDLENMTRNWMADNIGKKWSEVVARGIPTLAGVDLHRSLKLANAVDLPEITSFKSKDLLATLGAAMTGASGENITSVVDGLSKIFSGDVVKGIEESVAPRPVNDILQAYQFARQGVTDQRGGQILPPVSAYDAIAKGLGFNPSDIASAREARQAEIDQRDEVKDARTRIETAYVNAAPQDRGAVLQMLWQYNRTNPTSPITMQELQEAVKEHTQAVARPGTYGLRVPKKQLRVMQQAGRFGP